MTLSRSPVFDILLVLSGISFSNSRLLRFSVSVELCLSLEEVAVSKSAFNPVEEISYKSGFLSFVDSLKELRVHLSLEELVHINLQVRLDKSLFSERDLVHVGVEAHLFNGTEHLCLGLDFRSFSRGGQ